jgi:hypothetical protein
VVISHFKLNNIYHVFINFLDSLCNKEQYKKESKYDDEIRKYILDYILKKVNFSYRKLKVPRVVYI